MEAAIAGQELRGLVDAGLIDQEGVGRWTTYSLKVAKELPEQLEPATEEDKILVPLREKDRSQARNANAYSGWEQIGPIICPRSLSSRVCYGPRVRVDGASTWQYETFAAIRNLSGIFPDRFGIEPGFCEKQQTLRSPGPCMRLRRSIGRCPLLSWL
jgi:hypothetical protein